jgi:hypothetical protein
VLRAFDFAVSKAELLRKHRDQLKPEVIWNIEQGLKLSVEQIERAEAQRVAMAARALSFFKTYDLLLLPATIVPPYPIQNRYVGECAGIRFDIYVEWLGIVYAITLVCCPARCPCLQLHRRGPAGWLADGRKAARGAGAFGGRKSTGRYLGRAQHDTDRSPACEINKPNSDRKASTVTRPPLPPFTAEWRLPQSFDQRRALKMRRLSASNLLPSASLLAIWSKPMSVPPGM